MGEFLEKVKNFFISESTVNLIVKILIALVVLIIGKLIVKSIVKRIDSGKIFKRSTKTVRLFLKHLISISLYILIAVAIISILGFDVSAISAAIASAGLAIGLALQGGLSNIAGGIMLVGFKPFEVGDFVEGAGIIGTVTDIGLFYTTLTTPDNKKVVVPNATMSNSVVTNYSVHDTRRMDFDFTIAYTASIDTARKVLLACAKSDERIFTDPKPEVMITAHNDSSVTIRLRVWVKNSDYWDVNFAMMEQVKRSFDEFGVEIPFPQVDVHIAK